MSAFLWFLIVIGLIEVGGACAYLITGKWPERTRGGIWSNLLFWALVAGWAIHFLRGAA